MEPIMGQLSNQSWFSYQKKGGHEDHARRLKKNVSNAPVEMRAFLARTTISLNDLLGLQVGDIITTEKPSDGEAFIQVEGRNKFKGRLGRVPGGRPIRITRVIADSHEQAPTGTAEMSPQRGDY